MHLEPLAPAFPIPLCPQRWKVTPRIEIEKQFGGHLVDPRDLAEEVFFKHHARYRRLENLSSGPGRSIRYTHTGSISTRDVLARQNLLTFLIPSSSLCPTWMMRPWRCGERSFLHHSPLVASSTSFFPCPCLHLFFSSKYLYRE